MLEQLGAVLLPAETFRRLAHRFSRRRVGQQFANRGGDRVRVAGDETAGRRTVDDVAGAADIGRDDRRAAGERLDPDVGEALVRARLDGDIRRSEQGGQFFMWPNAEQAHARSEAEPLRQPRQVRSFGAVADQDQGRVGNLRQRLEWPDAGPCSR